MRFLYELQRNIRNFLNAGLRFENHCSADIQLLSNYYNIVIFDIGMKIYALYRAAIVLKFDVKHTIIKILF